MSSTTIASTTTMKVEVPHVLKLLMLPEELILSCLARVPKLYYPTLALVSKSFRSLINSPELCKTRSLLPRTESCLYVCYQFENERNTQWFTLYRNPYQTVDDNSPKNKLCDHRLAPIPSSDFPPLAMSGVAAVGSDIYVIGGGIDGVSSPSVFVMDSHYHIWRKVPSMHVARLAPSASVLDGKIYVTRGGLGDRYRYKEFYIRYQSPKLDYTNWMEVFDTKTQTWEFMPSPRQEIGGSFENYESVAVEGSIYLKSEENKRETFNLHKGKWRRADIALTNGWITWHTPFCYCVIKNVLYRYCCGIFTWYDFIDKQWRKVKGLEGRLPNPPNTDNHQLADYGEKMVLLWEEKIHAKNVQNRTLVNLVWCAEISLERRQRSEICGTVEWCNVVFTHSKQIELVHVIATTA